MALQSLEGTAFTVPETVGRAHCPEGSCRLAFIQLQLNEVSDIHIKKGVLARDGLKATVTKLGHSFRIQITQDPKQFYNYVNTNIFLLYLR